MFLKSSESIFKQQEVGSNYLSSAQSLVKSTHKLIKSFSKSNVFQDLEKIFSNFDFEDLKKRLDTKNRRKIAYFLSYDIYLPIQFLNEFEILYIFKNQEDADWYLEEQLEFFVINRGLTIYDFVPKSLKTFKEINGIKVLVDNKMYKLPVLFCLERIENNFAMIQLQEQDTEMSKLLVSNKSLENFITLPSSEDKNLIDLPNQINIYSSTENEFEKKINLFKKFKEVENEFKQGQIMLNRNIFMHGLVNDEQVSFLLAQKAIMAYGFFLNMYYLKKKNKLKIVQNHYKRKGFSKMKRGSSQYKELSTNRLVKL